MLQDIKQISILNQVFNVRGNEWSKILFSWVITLFYRVGFVIGWTVLVAMFVSDFGIARLPFLFVINAIFSISGSFLYSVLIDRFKTETLMISTIFCSAFLIFLSYFFSSSSQILYYSFLVVAIAVFLNQFRILSHGFIEEMFSPVQSERAFPLVESADTIGGIFGGLVVVILGELINPVSFLLIWIGALFLIVPFVFFCEHMHRKVSKVSTSKLVEVSGASFLKTVKEKLADPTVFSFLRGLFLIVFFNWLLFNLLEFQYTKAVYQSVSNVVLDSGSGFSHTFVHDLGKLFILFSFSALIIQLFIGSRLITSLGIFGSMLLHPIVTFFSVLGFTFSFSFHTAVLAKTNFTVTSVLFINSYHSSYYALSDRSRAHIREFFDGIVTPFAAIVGMSVVILMQRFLLSAALVFYVNVFVVCVSILLFYFVYSQQRKYTKLALCEVEKAGDTLTRFNAVDILSQKGHDFPISVLVNMFEDEDESLSFRVKLLRAFAEIRDIDLVPVLCKALHSPAIPIRRASLDALLSFSELRRKSSKNLVLDFNLIEELKRAFRSEKVEDIRFRIVKLLSLLSTVSTFEFLIELLSKAKGSLKSNIVLALGNYEDPDVVSYIKPYLYVSDTRLKSSAVISVGRFVEFRDEAYGALAALLNSGVPNDVAAGLYAIGELKIKKKRELCFKHLNSKESRIRIHAAIALAKMGCDQAVPTLINLLFDGNRKIASETKTLLENVDVRIYKNLDRILKHLVIEKIDAIIPSDGTHPFKDLSKKDLETLKWLYTLVEEYDEIKLINAHL